MTAPAPHPRLLLSGVTRRFGAVTALDDIALNVARGDVICLVGPSGCGKSTLLRVIAGLEPPDAGQILIDGCAMSGPGGFVEPEARNIGFMFQDYALFPHLSVAENIRFGLKRLPRADAQARGDQIVARLGLGHLVAKFPHMLSGGEQQRVALARALAPQPGILLMDEPFSNLDRSLRDGIRAQTIALLRELGTTVIMVTHDPEEALSAGDQVVLMRAGAIVQQGSGSDLYDRPVNAYVAGFFSAFNRIAGACRDGVVKTPLGRFPAPSLADGPAVLHVRPHDLCLEGSGGVDCTVLDCVLMGEIEQTHVAVAGLEAPLKIRSTRRSGLRPGQQARVSVLPERIFFF